MGAAIIAGVDAPPVFEFTEHVLDAMVLTVAGVVVRDRDFAIRL